jgi:hypothetical protein
VSIDDMDVGTSRAMESPPSARSDDEEETSAEEHEW